MVDLVVPGWLISHALAFGAGFVLPWLMAWWLKRETRGWGR